MKKIIVSVLLVALCLSAVFAASNTFKVSVVPYGLQISTSTATDQDPVKSRYGYGAQAIYQRDLISGVYAEAGLAWNTFLLPDERPSFVNLMAFAGVGYRHELTEKVSCAVHVDAGLDTLFYKSKVSETFAIAGGLDVSYVLSENLRLSVGCDGVVGFSKNPDVNYVNYRVLPNLGLCIAF